MAVVSGPALAGHERVASLISAFCAPTANDVVPGFPGHEYFGTPTFRMDPTPAGLHRYCVGAFWAFI